MILLSSACGDTNNYYNVNSGDNGSNPGKVVVDIKTCEDVANREYECNPQSFIDYKNKWNISIEDQLKHAASECSPQKVDFFKNAPLWIKCISENSCEYINAGKCDQYMPEF